MVDQAEPDNKGIWFSPDGTLFVVEYFDKPAELRRADGSLVSTLAGTANAVTFSSDNRLFVVRYRAKPGELWETQGPIRRLTVLTNLNTFAYDPKATRIVVQDSTGQAYTVATDWLNNVADYADKLAEEELIKRTCTGLIAHFDEKELHPYLENRTPRGCRFS